MAKKKNPEPQVTDAKYTFIDVVGFTHERSVEAQSDIVVAMNDLVRDAIASEEIDEDSIILIPTGDGVCVGLLDVSHPYDIHIRLAKSILAGAARRNRRLKDEARKFELRVGVGANTDNLVVDVNGRKNVAGAGISTAQRVMSLADGGQIMASQSVFDVLSQREAYLGLFRKHTSRGKHGQPIRAYQLILEDAEGVNCDVPSAFAHAVARPKHLSPLAACLLAEAIENEPQIVSLRQDGGAREYALCVLLYFRAFDRAAALTARQQDVLYLRARPQGASFVEQFQYYYQQEYWLYYEVCARVAEKELSVYWDCFEGPSGSRFLFASQKGRERLQEEWPDLASTIGS